MKKLLLAVVVAGMLMFSADANASTAPIQKVDISAEVQQPTADAVAARRGPIRGILRGLIDLERRKNAWLRRTFLS